jgi:outer membrane protein assembly factor BamA
MTAVFVFGYFFSQTLSAKTIPIVSVDSALSPSCQVTKFEVKGALRSRPEWILSLLPYAAPIDSQKVDLDFVQSRLMSTDIFTKVVPTIVKDRLDCRLEIAVEDKWTRIPVIRGAYGGGTPLLVIGGYETNLLGRGLQVGAEMQRYGNNLPGLMVFAKAPLATESNLDGSTDVQTPYGAELWVEKRRRAFYQGGNQVAFYADSDATTGKVRYLRTLKFNDFNSHAKFQLGLHVEAVSENPTKLLDKDLNEIAVPEDFDVENIEQSKRSLSLQPLVVYDNIRTHQLAMSGLKSTLRVGPELSQNRVKGSIQEFEVFDYTEIPGGWNLALHGFTGSSSSKSLRRLYYLGGFDSVRGLPDGLKFGNKAAFLNAEIRYFTWASKYLHVQSALFFDTGTAGMTNADLKKNIESSSGFGVRLSIPQVYRLLVRIDYAVATGQTRSQGLSLSLGQFFQPTRLIY